MFCIVGGDRREARDALSLAYKGTVEGGEGTHERERGREGEMRGRG
jgi:hypothetical protein